jgi:primosomal protein N' (replication factor Y)
LSDSLTNTLPFAARVLIPGLARPFSYALPEDHQQIQVGNEVIVELGRRLAKGWVVDKLPMAQALEQLEEGDITQRSDAEERQLGLFAELKAAPRGLKQVRSAAPAFLPSQLRLFEWMAQYYGASLSEIIDNAIPARADGRQQRAAAATDALRAAADAPEYLDALRKKAPLQAAVAEMLLRGPDPVALSDLRLLGASIDAALRALVKRQLACVTFHEEPYPLQPGAGGMFSQAEHAALTRAQQAALEQIEQALSAGAFAPYLLFGVTGSGKTEVYLRAVERVLSRGGSALVIIPEISLTPQFIDQFSARLRAPIALLHSQVGASSRWRAWQALLRGEVRVAVGARSAVFAPLNDLSLVIVDEEHESSYKQSDGLRYHARDVAVMRAKLSGCPIILGSATPSFESLLNVQRGCSSYRSVSPRARCRRSRSSICGLSAAASGRPKISRPSFTRRSNPPSTPRARSSFSTTSGDSPATCSAKAARR